MMVSTRGRYALRVMTELAERNDTRYVPIKLVAASQGISLKYIERIMPLLTERGLVEGLHGKGGGYRLTREPREYTVGEILRAAEGELAPVACLKDGSDNCPRSKECKTLPMWNKFYEMSNDFFDSITLEALVMGEI